MLALSAQSNLSRYAVAILGAATATVGLVVFMEYLVRGGELRLNDSTTFVPVDAVWEKDPPLDIRKPRSLPERVEPIEVTETRTVIPDIGDPEDGISLDPQEPIREKPVVEGPAIAVDRGAYPKFRVQHEWPRRALTGGISGCAIVGFTIIKTGGVANPVILDESSGLFSEKALKAVSQYKYEPWILNGQPVATRNQTIRLVWEIEGESLPAHPACN